MHGVPTRRSAARRPAHHPPSGVEVERERQQELSRLMMRPVGESVRFLGGTAERESVVFPAWTPRARSNSCPVAHALERCADPPVYPRGIHYSHIDEPTASGRSPCSEASLKPPPRHIIVQYLMGRWASFRRLPVDPACQRGHPPAAAETVDEPASS
jgi:hypothetical protein